MEYDLFNNYEDKINYLKNQNLLIDELGLTGRIPKLNVRDSATENSNKINILREMWNGYKSPLFSAQTGRDLLATHLLWKTNLMRRLKSEALSCGVTNFDADLVVGTKYTKDTNPINASGLKTYLMDPHSISSLYLVEFTSPIELKNHAASLVAKGLVSGNLNVFLTCQKVIFFGLEYGLTKRNVANFLLQILERETPSYVSLVKGSVMTPEQIFENVLDTVRSNSDVQAIKHRIESCTRNLGTGIRTVISGLSKLVEEYISLQYPFESAEKKQKRLEKHLMAAMNEFVEDNTRAQLIGFKEVRYQQDKPVDLRKCLDFIEQLETKKEYCLKTPKSASSKAFGLTAMYNMTAKGSDLLPAPPKEYSDMSRASSEAPKVSKKKRKKSAKDGKSGSSGNAKDKTPAPKSGKAANKPKQANVNQVKPSAASGANKTSVVCAICGCNCGNQKGKGGKCNNFPGGVEEVTEKCGLCGIGYHVPGVKCGFLFRKRQEAKNLQKGR